MSIFHKPIKIRQQMQNTNCTRFVYHCIIMRDGFPRCRRVFHRAFFFRTAPLYFAKFIFSEIVCFAKHPSPGPDVLRRAAVSGGVVMASARCFCFAVPQWDHKPACVLLLYALCTTVRFLLIQQLRSLCLIQLFCVSIFHPDVFNAVFWSYTATATDSLSTDGRSFSFQNVRQEIFF